jgi:flagellar hook-associated protein 2
MVGIRVNTGSGIDPKMIEQLIEIEREPIKQTHTRKKAVIEEQKQFNELKSLVNTFGNTLNGLRNKHDFYKLKLISSHPDFLEGSVDNTTPPGHYEMEVLSLAKNQKLLTQAFPDKDETPVGFGYMTIEFDDHKTVDVDIDPDKSTLQEVATKINSMGIGAKAIVINTREHLENQEKNNYRLLVFSEKSGKEAKIFIDPDTTYLEFYNQEDAKNLEIIFENVRIFNDSNKITEILPGMVLDVKKAEPGKKISIKVDYDVEKTLELIKKFVENYNKINDFLDKQFKINPETNQAGALSKDNTLRTLRKSIQSALQFNLSQGKYQTLADIGISTDAKTGALKYDEAKAQKCFTENYSEVAKLFIQSEASLGIGSRMSNAVRDLQNQKSGILSSKEREYKRLVENFDKSIATKERLVKQKEEIIRRKFTVMEQLISGMQTQGQAMQQKLANMG